MNVAAHQTIQTLTQSPIEESSSSFPFIIYVDDSNVNGPWDGTLEHPFQTIMDGYNAASDGNTIYVFNGTYLTHWIKIKKSVRIVGQNKINTNVQVYFDFTVFNIQANDVRIENLTLIGNAPLPPSFWEGTIVLYGDRCTIKNNKIINNKWGTGILIDSGMNNIIQDNIFGSNLAGIRLHKANHCLIKNNLMSHTGPFIFDDSSHNIISENNLHSNIELKYSPYNIFKRNNIYEGATFSSYLLDSINFWRSNYWNGFTKPIHQIIGTVFFPIGYNIDGIIYKTIRWSNYDLHAAIQPYNISQ